MTSRSTKHPWSRRRFLQAGTAAAGTVLVGADLQVGPLVAAAQQLAARITTTDLGGMTLFQGAGCNVLAMAGPDEERRQGVPGDRGALMIDGGLAANADALLAAVKSATGATRINTLINTHGHPEQTGVNEAVGKSGGVIFAHEKTQKYLSNTVESVTFKGRRPALPQAARPTKTTRAAPPPGVHTRE